MDRKRRRPGSDQGAPMDLGFGELFRGIGNLVDLVAEMSERGETATERTGEIGSGKLKGVYGLSVKVGLGGLPTVEQFGNIRKGAEGPVVEEVREPLVDVFDEGDRVLVVAELPGVQEKDMKLQVEGDVLSLATEGTDRKYAKEMVLPFQVDPEPFRRSYQNGILEMEFKRASAG